MKIIKIGAVVLDYGLWWDEFDTSSKVVSAVKKNLDGGSIVFEQPVRNTSINITAKSRDDGWQSKETVDAIKSLVDASIGTTTTVEDSDANIINIRFRHEVAGGAVQFERIADALTIGWYKGVVYLARI